MVRHRFIHFAIIVAFLVAGKVHSQTDAELKHFEKNGLEFDYPAAWKVTEGGGDDSEYVELASEGKTAQLVIRWQLGAILDCEFEGLRKRSAQELADRVAVQVHTSPPPGTAWQKINIGKSTAEQLQLRGVINKTEVAAFVYSFNLKHCFLTLLYIRGANDERGNSAWETIRRSLKVEEFRPSITGKSPADGGVLNGKAILLPKPDYPAFAKAVHASGVVVVQVLINERGDVVQVCTLSGARELQKVSEDAARAARFSPTKLSGRPVQVMGVITYNFMTR
jgi:TonB family protein